MPDARGVEDPYEGAVPPGYDWPTHGGYLGCLLGLIVSFILASAVGAPLFALSVHHAISGITAGLLIAGVYIVLLLGVGRLGYVLGKRFLREYPQPQGKTWGEDDDYVDPTVEKRMPHESSAIVDPGGTGIEGAQRAAFSQEG